MSSEIEQQRDIGKLWGAVPYCAVIQELLLPIKAEVVEIIYAEKDSGPEVYLICREGGA